MSHVVTAYTIYGILHGGLGNRQGNEEGLDIGQSQAIYKGGESGGTSLQEIKQ
jgi:hypothetical protein